MAGRVRTKCGHRATTADGLPLVCDLPAGHKGLHEKTDVLRDGKQRTNWGDDGKAAWATSDEARLHPS